MTTFPVLNSFVVAGMPSISLTDIARMRLDTISFFVLVVVVSAWVIKLLWNSLQRDFTRLPRLSYRGSLAGVVLWGLAFIIVLTMISGARELMTPGAWTKNGLTYKLNQEVDRPDDTEPDSANESQETARQDQLRSLWRALVDVSATRSLPDRIDDRTVAAKQLQPPGVVGGHYLFGSCRDLKGERQLLAFEPEYFANGQYALFTDGTVTLMNSDAIAGLLNVELADSTPDK